MLERTDKTIATWLALLLFGVYLLSFSGRFYSQDSMLMFSVTESFVKRGEFGADQMWTIYKARDELGPDGEAYSKTGYGTSLLAAPLYALALALPGDVGLTQTTLLTSSILIALTGALVFLAVRRLKYARGVSLFTALLFGLATPAWVYAKQFWSESFALFTLFAAFYFLLCFRQHTRARDVLIAGIALGLGVATRVPNAALVPFFAWYGFVNGAPQAATAPNRPSTGAGRIGAWVDAVEQRVNLRGLFWFAAPLALFALSIVWYDWTRYGSPLATGYRADETFDNPLLFGLYGLLFSPGKGLFVYTPFLAALPWAGIVFFRRASREVFLFFVISAFYLVTFSTWYYWWGGTNWGPRFLVPLLPFLVLLVAPAVELAANTNFRSKAHVAVSAIFLALCLSGVGFELLGVSVPSLAYRAHMLHLSANADMDSIFIPKFSPLVGAWSMLKPSVLDFGWIRALGDAVSIDWLVIALTAAFIALCGVALWLNLRGDGGRKTKDAHSSSVVRPSSFVSSIASSRRVLLAMTAMLAALSLFSLYRYRDDFRFGGNDGYHVALQTVRHDAQPGDVMVLDNDVWMPYFLNEDRASIRWYGLSRDPKQWDAATRALLTRLAQQYARVWFAYDDSTGALPDPTRDWLNQSLHSSAQRDFSDGVHLTLYATGSSPASARLP